MKPLNRRQFVRASALAALAVCARGYGADAEKKRVGVIGCGWYGKSDLFRLLQVAPVEVVSLCDVDRRMLEDAAEMTAARQLSKKKPRLYHDYRELLREKDLDIVIIGTPDHWHALQLVAAVEAGADVYLQKPISVDIREGQAMLAAARKHQRVVQVGTQRRSTPHLIEAREEIVGRENWAGSPMWRFVATTRCARAKIRRTQRRRNIWITKCGRGRRRCGPTTAWCIRAGGGRSWNMATAFWGTCACICST